VESTALMVDKLRESRSWQLLLIATLVLLIPLMADISHRMSVLHRMHQKRAQLTLQLAQARAENDELNAQLEFVAGDAFLEQWARVEARLARPGEVAAIPLFEDQTRRRFTALDDKPSSEGTPSSMPQQWRRLFFDEPATP
jgi:cell division protein FtsB